MTFDPKPKRHRRLDPVPAVATLIALLIGGCAGTPRMLPTDRQRPIDRSLVTTPKDFALEPYVRGLTAPTSLAWDADGTLLVAEGGWDQDPRILGFRKDGTPFTIYPHGTLMVVDIGKPRFTMRGPIGGMLVYKGRIYVSHRDDQGYGRITALNYTGGHTTIVAHLPAQGDYSVTDLTIDPRLDRLYFGVGAATNSGVVGLDNWEWVRYEPKVHDMSWVNLHLAGFRFDSPNPFSGLFGPADIAVTAPFQAFNVSNQTEIPGTDLPNAAIYSCSPDGGDLKVEAHGIRYPRGLGFDGYSCYFTNEGMELRGTRPVRNDPDALLRLIPGTWYGWPDYTTNLEPVSIDKFQPPPEMISQTGYLRVRAVINQPQDMDTAGGMEMMKPSDHARSLLYGVFAPLSGAAKLDFVPDHGPFRIWYGQAIVALEGDRAPFDTSGRPIIGPIGYKLVLVNTDRRQVTDFVWNTARGPGSRINSDNPDLLERPVDVKFGPDGNLYILDAGKMHMHNGREEYEPGTGRIFRLVPQSKPVMYPPNVPAGG